MVIRIILSPGAIFFLPKFKVPSFFFSPPIKFLINYRLRTLRKKIPTSSVSIFLRSRRSALKFFPAVCEEKPTVVNFFSPKYSKRIRIPISVDRIDEIVEKYYTNLLITGRDMAPLCLTF